MGTDTSEELPDVDIQLDTVSTASPSVQAEKGKR